MNSQNSKPDPFNKSDSTPDLRSDLLPGSQSIPDRSLYHERLTFLTPARLISLLIIIILLILGWVFIFGPGRTSLEKGLASLAERIPSSTKTPPAAVKNTVTPLSPVITGTATSEAIRSTSTAVPGSKGTSTPLPSSTALESALPPSETTTSLSGSMQHCVPAKSISLTELGQTLCVTGNVLRTEADPGSFLIILEKEENSFYFLSYDRSWDDLKPGTCVFARGKIQQLGNNPVMVLNYKIPLEFCP
jgi:hypothetical protein